MGGRLTDERGMLCKERIHQVQNPGAESMPGLFKDGKEFRRESSVCWGKRRNKGCEAAGSRACGVLKDLIRS